MHPPAPGRRVLPVHSPSLAPFSSVIQFGGMSGAATQATEVPPVVRRQPSDDDDVDRVLVWAFQRRKVFIAAIAMVCTGVGAGWKGIQQIEAAAQERLLHKQAAVAQSKAVRANGKAVEALGFRVGGIETDIEAHAEMTRTVVRLLMASPQVVEAVEADAALKARAARVVGSPAK